MNQRQFIATVPRQSSEESVVSADEEPGSKRAEDPPSLDDEPPHANVVAAAAAAAHLTPHERTPRPALWADVPDEEWDDWHWQLAHRLNSLEELSQIINLTPEEIDGLSADDKFRVDITPYFASLIDPDDPLCPVRRQVIPQGRELEAFEGMMEDSLAEDAHSPVPGLVHRYPDRVLMLVTTQCASYCRYCTRSRIVGNPHENFSKADFEAQLEYLRRTPQVRDVLMSGGDPLTLAPKTLNHILSELRKIEHIEIIRIGSRVPVFLPQRITDEFCAMIRQYHPLWMNIHTNHPKEITPELSRALDKLSYAGVPLGNQSVLLAGINDSVNIQRELVHKLVKNRVRPYYLYQCDLVKGAGHFRTTVSKGIEIIEGLRGHTSGYAVPTYVVDAPGGGGKIPVMPQYLISQAPGKVVLRNYEGYITSYEEPTDYDPHVIDHLDRLSTHSQEPGQSGVLGLLEGDALAIKPEGFDGLHKRGAGTHRLNADATKWKPYHQGEVMSDGLRVASPPPDPLPASQRGGAKHGDENDDDDDNGEFVVYSNGHGGNEKIGDKDENENRELILNSVNGHSMNGNGRENGRSGNGRGKPHPLAPSPFNGEGEQDGGGSGSTNGFHHSGNGKREK